MASFALAIFLGAFLLFQVQPMIGKFILPWFGGGPGIWTACMLFFQLVLLAGYAYAHWLSSRLRPRRQVVLHLTLLGLALLLLPITPSDSWKPHGTTGDPRWQILFLLAASVGLPYFALSATGPLVQSWFSRVRPGASPYRLYALSNAGSLLALLSYPFYFETRFPRQTQAGLWGWGLVAFALSCAFCASRLWRAADPGSSGSTEGAANTQPASPPRNLRVSPGRRWLWLLLPACASILLLAFTNKLCQDVTVIPLLWVVPLALYLLSFIVCFDSPRWYQRVPFAFALVISISAICGVLSSDAFLSIRLQLAAYAIGLFVCCMVCHGELYRLRPAPEQLTQFYLMIAAGGALGGLFVTLVAPLMFTDYHELHCGLLLCGVLAMAAWLASPDRGRLEKWRRHLIAAGVAALSVLGVLLWRQAHQTGTDLVQRTRNFYGVLSVLKVDPSRSGSYGMKLTHGITTHGLQLLDRALTRLPTTYYGENSGVGRVLRSLPAEPRRIGVIGLGVGTLATYARKGDSLRLYEINPEVQRLAGEYFSYLSQCEAQVDVVLGDARLSLEQEPTQQFDLLVMDAFSSDAIPLHLLTREAFVVYGNHLKTNGVIAVHISNRHLDLEPVVAGLAGHFGYRAVRVRDETPDDTWWVMNSVWMVLCRNPVFLQSPLIAESALPTPSRPSEVLLWTDDFASIIPILHSSPPQKAEDDPVKSLVSMGMILTEQGDPAGAIARYQAALQLNPDALEALNNLAWLLATGSDASVRNGPAAVELAERACRLTQYRRTVLLGTLAAAYAEAGRFPEAIVSAEKACSLASESGDEVLLSRNRQLLEGYRVGKPYHEPVSSDPGR